LLLPGFVPTSLNRLTRGRRRDRIRLARGDRDIIRWHARLSGVPPATGPRRVSLVITLPPGERRCDPDAYWKSLLDGLRACGLLVNDSARWVVLGGIDWERGPRRTAVVLEDLTPGACDR
jgi:hypothetical protein